MFLSPFRFPNLPCYAFNHSIAFVVCFTILTITTYHKLFDGGWITLLVTTGLIMFSFYVNSNYNFIESRIKNLDVYVSSDANVVARRLEPIKSEPTMVLFVSSYRGVCASTLKRLLETYKGVYRNIVFISVAIVDSGSFKGVGEIEHLKAEVTKNVLYYVAQANQNGLAADYRVEVDIDVASAALRIYKEVRKEYRVISTFSAQLHFYGENFSHKLLHNDQALTLQRHFAESKIFVQLVPTGISLA